MCAACNTANLFLPAAESQKKCADYCIGQVKTCQIPVNSCQRAKVCDAGKYCGILGLFDEAANYADENTNLTENDDVTSINTPLIVGISASGGFLLVAVVTVIVVRRRRSLPKHHVSLSEEVELPKTDTGSRV